MQTFESFAPVLKLADTSCSDLTSCSGLLVWSEDGQPFDAHGFPFTRLLYNNPLATCTKYKRNQDKMSAHECKDTLTYICEFDCNNGAYVPSWLKRID